MEAGALRTVIDNTYDLKDISEAFARQMSSRAAGKIVVNLDTASV